MPKDVRFGRTPTCHPDKRHHALGLCGACYRRGYDNREPRRAKIQKYRATHREAYRLYGRKLHQQHRDLVLDVYGHKCACLNCPETMEEFLEIDHIQNNGEEHRKNDKEANHLYRWLIKNNFPDGFQPLCSNCNQAKRRYGECPHTKEVSNE